MFSVTHLLLSTCDHLVVGVDPNPSLGSLVLTVDPYEYTLTYF